MSLEPHDRIMGIQYAAMAALDLGQCEKAIQLAHQGLQLSPLRAEFHVIVGDAYLRMGKNTEALPYLHAAKACPYQDSDNRMAGPLFVNADAYTYWPRLSLIRIYFQMGNIAGAKEMIEEARRLGPHEELELLAAEINRIEQMVEVSNAAKKTKDILITCPPGGFYEWDGVVMEKQGIGGSETAAVMIAQELHKKTGRRVLISNDRLSHLSHKGVEYVPAKDLHMYLQEHEPDVHIAWRHTAKLTGAKT